MSQDKKEVEDLLLNRLFSNAETSEGSDKVEDSDEAEFIAAFTETINNDRLIDWRYWAQQMPVWTPSQAARLLCGLDPDAYESYESRPTRNDVSIPVTAARKIERLADAQGIHSLSPAKWLAWAVSSGFPVHAGLRLAVESVSENNGPGQNVAAIQASGPIQRTLWQEREILRVINELGYNPTMLPPPQRGKAGVKSKVRAQLRGSEWQGTVFNKAWERLRATQEILDASPDAS